ncbi:MAG: DUF2065 domain-containing protein [Colwellia sp.]|nr:DUF2065 domain-containing protein [Colwellia sp.]
MTETFLTVLGLVLIIEGIGPALFPNRWRNYLLRITKEPIGNLRSMGMVMLLLGIVLLALK